MAADKLDNRNRLLQQMGLIYNQILDLNEQMTDALQKAVDIDISVTGGVSDITKEFMEGFHYKIDAQDRVVSEQKKWEYDQLPPVKEILQQKQDAATPKRNITQEELNKLLGEHRERHEAGNYEPLDLSNCVFNKIEFTGNLSDINFTESEFNDCTFRNVDMENSYLSYAEFMNTVFFDCTFDNSNFYGTEMGYCAIEYAVYTDCIFNKAAMVACDISSSGMNGCDMGEAIISDTKFTDVIANDCKGKGTINFSGIDKNLRTSAENIFINPKYTLDHAFYHGSDNMVVMIVHSEGDSKEQLFEFDYNLDTHKIDKTTGINDPNLSFAENALFVRAVDLLRMDIIRGFHERQIDHNKISRFSPCVMVETSEILGIKENTLYDIKEFSDRLESYGRVLDGKVSFNVMFDIGEGSIRKYHDRYDIRSDKDSLIERLENSKRFNNAEINYLKNYMSREMSPVIDITKMQHQEQDATPTEQEVPQKKESSQKEKHQTAIPAKYVALVYVKGSDVRIRVTGTSPEKIIELCQKWNTERASDNQLGTAYIKKYNPEMKAYENFGKYDVSKGVELQPIYLKLPPLGKQNFAQFTAELKANGAKFDPELKKWYVTQASDLSLFKDYLPKQSEPQIGAKEEHNKKKSVIDNLSQNKSHLNEIGQKGSQPHEQQRKQEAQAR